MSKNKKIDVPKELKNSEVIEELETTPKEDSITTGTKSIPLGHVLCKAEVDKEYKIKRDGIEYIFAPPDFTCALPEEVANLFDAKHIIKKV